jgi:type II secretion system protein D
LKTAVEIISFTSLLRQGPIMPGLQASTVRYFIPVVALAALGSWAVPAWAAGPDHRSNTGVGEPAPLLAQASSELNPSKKKIQFQARSQPWSVTLDWLAQQTGLPVVASSIPDGTFTLFGSTTEKYTIPQVVDMINGQLRMQPKPMLLVRGKRDFQLIPSDPTKLDPTSLPRVTKNELDQHGDTELVILELPLETLTASDVAKELSPNNVPANRKLLGPLGQVVALPGTNHLILRDTVQTLRNIVHFLDDAEEFEKKKGGVFKHKCVYVKAKDAERILKDLLGIAPPPVMNPGQPGQPNMPQIQPGIQPGGAAAQQRSVHVSADDVSNTVFVNGPPDKIELAKKTLTELDVPKPGQPALVIGPPIVRTYKVPAGNAADVAKALKELYASRSVTVSPVGKDSIIVMALPDDQDAIERYLQGAKDQADFEAIPLFTLEAKKVYDNLKILFDVDKGPAPILDVDIPRNLILVRGTKEQVTAVKEVVKKLGEEEGSDQSRGKQVTITLERGSAVTLAKALNRMIPKMRKNPVRLVLPVSTTLTQAPEAPKETTPVAATDGNGDPQLFDPQAQKVVKKNLPGKEDAPITLTAVGNKLYAACDDHDALKLVWELSRLLQTPAGEGDFEIIVLKWARAVDAAKTLDQAFNDTKQENRRFNPWWDYDYGQQKKEKEPRIRVVADAATNSLLVRANPLDMLTVRSLVDQTIDRDLIDSKALIKVHAIGPLKYASAWDVATLIKEIYAEHLNNTLSAIKSGATRNTYFGWGGLNLNTDAAGNPRPVDLTVTHDDATNTIIVACNDAMYESIEKLAAQMDNAAQNSTKVWMAVPVKGIDPMLIQQALDAIQGKHRNGTGPQQIRPPGGGGKGGGSDNSQSRGPDFFRDRVMDDPQLARRNDAHGGPGFFAHGVKDDPQEFVLYDPQRDRVLSAPRSGKGAENFQLVKLEEQQPPPGQPPPTTAPRAPRGPVTAEALPELGVIVLSASSQADLLQALRLIEFIQQIGAVAEIRIQIVELQTADATSVANTLTQLYTRVIASPAGNVRAPGVPTAPGVPRPGVPPVPGAPAQPPVPAGAPTAQPPGAQPAQQAPTQAQQLASVTLLPLPRINGILLAAPRARFDDVINEIKRLDVSSRPQGQTVPFPLRKASAQRVVAVLEPFFRNRYAPTETDATHQVRIWAEPSTNTVYVQAAPSDLEEIREMIARIDSTVSIAVNDLRIVRLNFALATDVATLLSQAINEVAVTPGPAPAGPTGAPTGAPTGPTGAPTGAPTGPTGAPTGAPPGPAGTPTGPGGPTTMGGGKTGKGMSLKFVPARPDARGPVQSGILEDIFVTPDQRTNSLIISAPEKTMELLLALIKDLDVVPNLHAAIKIFQLSKADAATVAFMLGQLLNVNVPPPRSVSPLPPFTTGAGAAGAPIPSQFAPQPTGGGPQPGAPGAQVPPLMTVGGVTPEGAPLIPVRINVDERTNSLIVFGTASDLIVVQAMIDRLEGTPVQNRQNQVYHLRNSSAPDVASAVTQFLNRSLTVLSTTGQLTPFQELEREVVVIPEPISNKLLISATPRFFADVMRVIEEIDSQPPQVVIQVLIAEVDLTNEEEFGVEIGLQNPVLFRRSVGATTINTAINGMGFAPGFNFNNPSVPLANNFAADPSIVGFQSLGSFGTGRVSPTQGVGGFVFSAANDTFNLLIRALKVQGRIDVLSRPQITTLDNQQAQINIGTAQPINAGTVFSGTAGFASANIQYVPIGVNLLVVPRVNPDNTVIMRVVPEVTSIANMNALTTIGPNGTSQSNPSFTLQHVETTVLAADGETVAIGGLIQKRDEKHENKIPWVGDLPYVGALFRFRTQNKTKNELLVILTPHIVRSALDAERILAEERRRMDWIEGDVAKVHGTPPVQPAFPPAPSPGLPGTAPNPALWPGLSCPLPSLPGSPPATPSVQESLSAPRTVPGPQSQAAPAPTGPSSEIRPAAPLAAADPPVVPPPVEDGNAPAVEPVKEKRGRSFWPWKK